MAITDEMLGVPIDDLIRQKGNKSSNLQMETISISCEGLFDEILKRFVATHDCVNINVVRYDKLQGCKAIIVYRKAIQGEKL